MCSPLFKDLECKIMKPLEHLNLINPLEPVNLINHCKRDEHANGKHDDHTSGVC